MERNFKGKYNVVYKVGFVTFCIPDIGGSFVPLFVHYGSLRFPRMTINIHY